MDLKRSTDSNPSPAKKKKEKKKVGNQGWGIKKRWHKSSKNLVHGII